MSLARLKISLAQSNPTVGGIEFNAQYVLVKAKEAEKKRSDLIIFPEMFLSGYQPLDLVNKRSFLENINYKFTFSDKNQGVCVAFNEAVKIATKKYIVLAHDDMYFCPNWDKVFQSELMKLPENSDFFLSGTMVQPFKSYINLNCGETIKDFNEQKLLTELPKIKFNDFQGTHWQPSLIPLKTWNKVGGFSEEFSPGLGSDPDFNMKLWNEGVRLFKGLGDKEKQLISESSELENEYKSEVSSINTKKN